MNINFTETEYRLLLDVIFLADWMQSSSRNGSASEDDEYQMLFQKVYSYARDMGCDDLVEEVVELNRYAPTGKYEQRSVVFEWVEDFEDAVFWEQLLERFVERDVYAELPADRADHLDEDEYWRRAAPYEQWYAEEFHRHGLDRLVVADQTGKHGSGR